MRRALPRLAAPAALAALTGCGSSGCDAFDPRSAPLAPGASVAVQVEVQGGRAGTLDVHGGYWAHPELHLQGGAAPGVPVPSLPAGPPSRTGTVTRTGSALVLEVDGLPVVLAGPLGCD